MSFGFGITFLSLWYPARREEITGFSPAVDKAAKKILKKKKIKEKRKRKGDSYIKLDRQRHITSTAPESGLNKRKKIVFVLELITFRRAN